MKIRIATTLLLTAGTRHVSSETLARESGSQPVSIHLLSCQESTLALRIIGSRQGNSHEMDPLGGGRAWRLDHHFNIRPGSGWQPNSLQDRRPSCRCYCLMGTSSPPAVTRIAGAGHRRRARFTATVAR